MDDAAGVKTWGVIGMFVVVLMVAAAAYAVVSGVGRQKAAAGAMTARIQPVSSRMSLASVRGEQGPQGMSGRAGAAGPSGPAGARGPRGVTGPVGPAGARGPAGPAGPAGVRGPTGIAGATGAIGPQGPMGAMGPAGPMGPAGTPDIAAWAYVVGDRQHAPTLQAARGFADVTRASSSPAVYCLTPSMETLSSLDRAAPEGPHLYGVLVSTAFSTDAGIDPTQRALWFNAPASSNPCPGAQDIAIETFAGNTASSGIDFTVALLSPS
ncbi:MAG: hypothetical protein ABR600_04550 [Actinomycetota bacterium]